MLFLSSSFFSTERRITRLLSKQLMVNGKVGDPSEPPEGGGAESHFFSFLFVLSPKKFSFNEKENKKKGLFCSAVFFLDKNPYEVIARCTL